MPTCSATCSRSWNAQCRTYRSGWPPGSRVLQPVQATIATVRSNIPMAIDRTSAARPVLGKSSRCFTASQGSVLRHLPREAIIRVIRWLPSDRWRFPGFSSASHSVSPSPGGGVDAYRNHSQHDHEGGSIMKIIKNMKAIAVSAIVLTALVLPLAAEQPTKSDFSNEAVGAEPKSLVAVVGI